MLAAMDRTGQARQNNVAGIFARISSCKKNVVIAGHSRLEIWDEEVWNKYKVRPEQRRYCRKMSELGV